ncbi:phage prohead protease%2C HK97 family [Mycobacterium tuberculosis]|nr:phage prohead protease%2C HK97 family [Mycobacterium tuberculosis]
MEGQTTGTIAIVNGNAYGIIFDGMEDMGIHKWYVAEELMLLEDNAEASGMKMEHKSMKNKTREYRMMEIRAAENTPENEMIVEGYAIRFNEPAIFDFGGEEFREIIDSRALDMADTTDVPLKYNHSDHVMVMARTRNKTLQLIRDGNGLFIRANLADTTAGRDLYTLIRRGDIDKMSFAFSVDYENNGDEYDRKTRTRTIKRIKKIWDVAAVDTPAYNSTSISARSFFEMEIDKERKAAEAAELRKRLILKMSISEIIKGADLK